MVSAHDRAQFSCATITLHSPERAELIRRRNNSTQPSIWDALDQVKDPEIPVLSLWDLGVLRDLIRTPSGITVVITPTYTGCPAIDTMTSEIKACLLKAGFQKEQIQVENRLTPIWSTDWMSTKARQALRDYGIAPPPERMATAAAEPIHCPLCESNDTQTLSEFSSTACKALYRCRACGEPFDYFKPY